jgi:hypothetical protein
MEGRGRARLPCVFEGTLVLRRDAVRDAHEIHNDPSLDTGATAFSSSKPIATVISGALSLQIDGQGKLSFYAPATTGLGVSGDWSEYTGTLSGNATLSLSTETLTLNGNPLPTGSYSIETSAANLHGRGTSSASTFAGTTSIEMMGGTIKSGPASGNLSLNGNALDASQSLTLAGFEGTATVTAGNSSDILALNGTTQHVLRVAAMPTVINADSNTPVIFNPIIETSLADTYTLSAEVPKDWAVSINDQGAVTVTPNGLKSGSFPIHLTAQSKSQPDLVASGGVTVTIGPTQPGISAEIVDDNLFTVPFAGAQVSSAFRARIHNLGPQTDTFNLTVPTLPAGFELLNSGLQVTIPAGETGEVGLYLRPVGSIGAPGIPASFSMNVQSATNPGVNADTDKSFSLPEVHGVTLSADKASLSAIPGTSVETVL